MCNAVTKPTMNAPLTMAACAHAPQPGVVAFSHCADDARKRIDDACCCVCSRARVGESTRPNAESRCTRRSRAKIRGYRTEKFRVSLSSVCGRAPPHALCGSKKGAASAFSSSGIISCLPPCAGASVRCAYPLPLHSAWLGDWCSDPALRGSFCELATRSARLVTGAGNPRVDDGAADWRTPYVWFVFLNDGTRIATF